MSARVGTSNETLGDLNSPQYKASEWILEECEAAAPINPSTPSQTLLNVQRYALSVMFYSLGGQGWTYGRNELLLIGRYTNPSPKQRRDSSGGQGWIYGRKVTLDNVASKGTWMSRLNYCEWSAESTDSSNQLVCDEFGNVVNLNLRELYKACVEARRDGRALYVSFWL